MLWASTGNQYDIAIHGSKVDFCIRSQGSKSYRKTSECLAPTGQVASFAAREYSDKIIENWRHRIRVLDAWTRKAYEEQ